MLFSLFGLFAPRQRTPSKHPPTLLCLESLEARCLLSVVPVLNTDVQNIRPATVSQASIAPAGTVIPGSTIHVTYLPTSGISGATVTGWQGMTAGDANNEYLIAGNSGRASVLYDGTITGNGTAMLTPFGGLVRIYGVDNLGGGHVLLLGEIALFPRIGFEIDGNIINGSFVVNRDWLLGTGFSAYSGMGGIAVGARGFSFSSFGASTGFLYDLSQHHFLTQVTFPDAVSTTVTGIWYNGGTSYTICGGYSSDFVNDIQDPTHPIGHAFLVDYDSATATFSHWTSINDPLDAQQLSTFVGISSPAQGVYTLAADFAATNSDPAQGAWVTIKRNADGSFGPVDWVTVRAPGLDPSTNGTTVTGVYGNQIVGMVNGLDPFQATITITAPRRTIISPPAPTPVTSPNEPPANTPPSSANPVVPPAWVTFLANQSMVHDLSTSPVPWVFPDSSSAPLMFGRQAPSLGPTVGQLVKVSPLKFLHDLSGAGAVSDDPLPDDLDRSGDEGLPAIPEPLPIDGRPDERIVLAPIATMNEEVWPPRVSVQDELGGEDSCSMRKIASAVSVDPIWTTPERTTQHHLAPLMVLGLLGLENSGTRRKSILVQVHNAAYERDRNRS